MDQFFGAIAKMGWRRIDCQAPLQKSRLPYLTDLV
jgi:hypothetical protein